MKSYSLVGRCLAVLVLLTSIGWAAELLIPRGEAPGEGPRSGSWASSNKQYYGTAYESYDSELKHSAASATAPLSKVWFTGAQGVVTELFWPTLDNPQTRDTQFLVTDGKSTFYEERKDSLTTVEWLHEGVPVFHSTNRDKAGRFEIERWLVTDPDRDVFYQRIRIRRLVAGLRFYLHHNPSAANSPMGDSAFASLGKAPGPGLFAWQAGEAQAVVSTLPWKGVSAGYENTATDGFIDIQDGQMDYSYETARDGNVVLTGWVDLPETVGTTDFAVATGFGTSLSQAYHLAAASLHESFENLETKYTSQWREYQAGIKDLAAGSRDNGTLFRASVATIKSMEDKTYEGAFIASPTMPWGEYYLDSHPGPGGDKPKQAMAGGYHLVWPRDLYQMATSFMAINDFKSSITALNYLRRVQLTAQDGTWKFGKRVRSRDGSFWQNTWLDGEQQWSGVQQDEAGYPIILAYRLWKLGQIEIAPYWDMVRRAADFIVDFGPWTNQERWEDAFGVSPYAIAVQIAALWTAAEMAEAVGDAVSAARYRATGDAWSAKQGDNLEAWTFTTSGGLGDGKYYERIEAAADPDQIVDPDDEAKYELANGAGLKREKDVTDGGFLELARLGVRRSLDPHMVDTMAEYDLTVRVDLPGFGPGFFRYYGDRYNYDEVNGAQTAGMLWPLLTGERGHYELGVAAERGMGLKERRAILDPFIVAVERFASPSLMIPEQVWDQGPRKGLSTGSATPLGWAHGEYLKLLRSREEGIIFDQIPSVVARAPR